VYVNGKQYTWNEWQKVRASSEREQPAAAPNPSAPRAASCVTPAGYTEFPGDSERFDCSAGLGALTRAELARAGWRVDYVERIAAPSADASAPLYKYKLVISR
jgi:hypothetical protein